MRLTIRVARELRAADMKATVPDDVVAAFRPWKRGDLIPET